MTFYDGVHGGSELLMFLCIRCGRTASADPDTVPTVWVNLTTRCPLHPDYRQVQPRDAGCAAEPMCENCATIMRRSQGRKTPVDQLFPLHRLPGHAAQQPTA